MTPRSDFAALVRSFGNGALPTRSALDATWSDPDAFARALFDEAARALGTAKSRVFESYDFYHDLLSRHLAKHLDAFVGVDAQGRPIRLSYDALDASAAQMAQRLRARGLEPGDSVAIVQPIGPFYMTALLACLRLGLVVSCIEPRGRCYVEHCLERLAPDHVLADDSHRFYVTSRATLDLRAPAELTKTELGSHSYGASEPVLRAISAFDAGAAQEEPSYLELTAEQAYLALLRDALLSLTLRAAERVATPGLPPEQYQPQLLCTILLAGACFVDIDVRALEEHPERLQHSPVHVAGFGSALVRALDGAAKPLPFKELRRWFRNPLEPLDEAALDRHLASYEQRPPLGFNLLYDAAHGGGLLCSGKAPKLDALSVVPLPGLAWQLTEINLTGTPALFDSGLFTPAQWADGPMARAGLMLGGAPPGYVLAGAVLPLRTGRAYPAQLVASVIERHPGVDYAVLHLVRHPQDRHASVAIALLFVNPLRPREARARAPSLVREVRELLRQELGETLVPDRIEVYPLTPRLVDGLPDARWCAGQFDDGLLTVKGQNPAASALSALRRLFATPAQPT